MGRSSSARASRSRPRGPGSESTHSVSTSRSSGPYYPVTHPTTSTFPSWVLNRAESVTSASISAPSLSAPHRAESFSEPGNYFMLDQPGSSSHIHYPLPLSAIFENFMLPHSNSSCTGNISSEGSPSVPGQHSYQMEQRPTGI